jgi:hypothetical protein
MSNQKKPRALKRKTQSNIPKTNSQKKVVEEWYNLYKLYNQKKPPQLVIDNLADKMIQWINSPEPKTFFEEFLRLYQIRHEAFSKFLERSEKLKKAHQYTMDMLGADRYKKAYQENYYATFSKTQHEYSPSWKRSLEYHAKLKNMQESDNITRDDLNNAVKDILKSVEE